ncbi:oligosaccharide flippase family protein [Chitinophaga sp. ysch24]|uniref:Oligosaccharide flippase family protein n=2 Tax=Chitinophaga tropicalis TaxID=2683588 RepID=A0A7K1U3G0_9BACT|nr:oligosaccharide flippase family protein [Chitinophaga tropicalis]
MISFARKQFVNSGTLLRRAVKLPSFNILFSQSAVMVILIIADVVYARMFSTEMFGTWKQLALLINLVIPLMSLGIPEGFKYYAALDRTNITAHLGRVLALTALVFTIVFFLFSFGAVNLIARLLNNAGIIHFKYMVPVLFLVISINQIFRNLMINNQQTGILLNSAVVILIAGVFLIFLNVYSYHFFPENVLWILLALMFVVLFSIPSIMYLVKEKNILRDIKATDLTGSYRNYFKIGFPIFVATFIGVIGANLDKALVSSLTDVKQFAVYSVGAFEIPFFSMISASVSQSIFPQLVQLYNDKSVKEAKALWLKTTLRVTYITYPIILFLMIFAKPLIVLIFTDKYVDGVFIFKTFLLIGLWRNGYYGGLISASGKTKWITLYSAISLISNITFSFLMYKVMGIYGIAYGALMATVIVATLQLAHERLLGGWFRTIILNRTVLILVILILIFYFI